MEGIISKHEKKIFKYEKIDFGKEYYGDEDTTTGIYFNDDSLKEINHETNTVSITINKENKLPNHDIYGLFLSFIPVDLYSIEIVIGGNKVNEFIMEYTKEEYLQNIIILNSLSKYMLVDIIFKFKENTNIITPHFCVEFREGKINGENKIIEQEFIQTIVIEKKKYLDYINKFPEFIEKIKEILSEDNDNIIFRIINKIRYVSGMAGTTHSYF